MPDCAITTVSATIFYNYNISLNGKTAFAHFIRQSEFFAVAVVVWLGVGILSPAADGKFFTGKQREGTARTDWFMIELKTSAPMASDMVIRYHGDRGG